MRRRKRRKNPIGILGGVIAAGAALAAVVLVAKKASGPRFTARHPETGVRAPSGTVFSTNPATGQTRVVVDPTASAADLDPPPIVVSPPLPSVMHVVSSATATSAFAPIAVSTSPWVPKDVAP